MIVAIIFAILLFSLLIFVHELGHFMAAKLSGVQVNEFAMFMGPALVKWQRGETLYSIRCIPIGGYCAMEGEDEDTDNPRSFQKAAWWKRLIILVAGSFMNLIAGILIISVVLAGSPNYVAPEVGEVESWSSVSEGNGLQVGDVIKEFDGQKIRVYQDFTLATLLLPDGKYDITVQRDGKLLELQDVNMELRTDPEDPETVRYGISFESKDTTFKSVITQIIPSAFNQVRVVFTSLAMLFTGRSGLKDMMGPVGIVDVMSQTAATSDNAWYAFLNMMSFGGMIAINLAVMNMLPFPALDGGRTAGLLLTTLVEKITKKKIPSKIEGYIHAGGMILLLILMGVILFKDVFTIFMR